MPKQIEGELLAADGVYALVVSRFNESVTRRLLDGAVETLQQHGVLDENILVVWVPGSFEIPLVADRLAKSGRYAAVCCLGAVIQGETDHHEHINREVSHGIMQSSLSSGVPVLFGVLTCQSMELALNRAGGNSGNKGSDIALAAIEMVNLLKKLPSRESSL